MNAIVKSRMPDGGRLMPPVRSKAFLISALLAFRARPREALQGLGWIALGKRVRGWGVLGRAATRHPNAYAAWVRSAEAALVERWLDQPERPAKPVAGLTLRLDSMDPEAATVTLRGLEAALGADLASLKTPQAIREDAPLARTLAALYADGARWLVPMIAGDRPSPWLGAALRRAPPHAELLFWDEDRREGSRRVDPWLKPAWDPLLAKSRDPLTGAAAIDISFAQKIADGLPSARTDLAGFRRLLSAAAASTCPVHLPLIMTHRALPPVPLKAPAPIVAAPHLSVSIIIPVRDKPALLAACIAGLDRSRYSGETELIIVDNGSQDEAMTELLNRLEAERGARVLPRPGPFNFSRLNNDAAAVARGELLCLLNNDVEPIDDDWLTHMAGHAADPRVGAVGAMLLYPDGTIQHAGVAIGMGNAAGHIQRGVHPDERLHAAWHAATRRVSAVTAACLVVRAEHYRAAGGLDDAAFPVAYNDVDFCLRLQQRGLANIYCAEARLLHHESKSRGLDKTPEKARRFASELAALQDRWSTATCQDTWFHPMFDRGSERCALRWPT